MEIRGILCNIPNVDAYIAKRTAVYLSKVSRSNNNTYPKKFLAAWITGKRKNGAPQLTCNNNFANSIQKILPVEKILSNKQALLRVWDIDAYFESCSSTDYSTLLPVVVLVRGPDMRTQTKTRPETTITKPLKEPKQPNRTLARYLYVVRTVCT